VTVAPGNSSEERYAIGKAAHRIALNFLLTFSFKRKSKKHNLPWPFLLFFAANEIRRG